MLKKNISLLMMLSIIVTCIDANIPDRKYKTADLIIFSFNRPMQVYALLESIHSYVTNLNQIYIIYRTSNQEYDNAYNEIKSIYPNIHYLKQGSNPRGDFKPLLLNTFFDSTAEYIMFSVDDDMVKDFFDINECVDALGMHNAHGFYLRLGLNMTENYPTYQKVDLPSFTFIENNMLLFKFDNGTDGWAYPQNIDMTIFKKTSIQSLIQHGNYSSPNTLEIALGAGSNLNNYGLCFKTTKKFMVALNIIQQDWWVPNENSFSIEHLFTKWQQGLKIDISKYFQLNNTAIIVNQKPTFIPRNK